MKEFDQNLLTTLDQVEAAEGLLDLNHDMRREALSLLHSAWQKVETIAQRQGMVSGDNDFIQFVEKTATSDAGRFHRVMKQYFIDGQSSDGLANPNPRQIYRWASICRKTIWGLHKKSYGGSFLSLGVIFRQNGSTIVSVVLAVAILGAMLWIDPHSSTWRVAWYDNQNLAGEPAVVSEVDRIDFDWKFDAPTEQISADRFSARFESCLQIDEDDAKIQLSVGSDDGVRVYVGGKKVMDQWRQQEFTYIHHQMKLAKGAHKFVVEYQDVGGLAGLKGFIAVNNSDLTSFGPPFFSFPNDGVKCL